ncbi:MAG: tetratricopeptide repeat protein [Wenzhouxiangella sp.]
MATDPNLIRQANGLISSGRFDEATDLCIRALATRPRDPDLLTALALCDEARGDLTGAIERLHTAADADRDHVDSRYQLGRLHAAGDRRDEARRMFDECLLHNPNHAPARTMIARLDHLEGRVEEALTGLRTVLRTETEYVPALVTMANILAERGELEAASEHASQAVQLKPDNAGAQIALGQILQAQGYYTFAERCLRNAIEADPENPRTHLAMGALLQLMDRHQEAVRAFGEAERLGVTGAEAVLARARSLRRLGRLDEARSDYESLLEAGSLPEELALELADMHFEAGDRRGIETLIERLGESEVAELVRARLAEAEGDAETAAQRVAGIQDSDNDAIAIRARMQAARLAERAGDPERAAGLLEPLTGRDDMPATVFWELARLQRRAGQYDAAVATLDVLLARGGLRDEEKARSQAMRLDLLDRAGRHAEAADTFAAAAWQDPFLGNLSRSEQMAERDLPDWESLDQWRWPEQPPDDGRPDPLFITGWPMDGRDLLVPALALAPELRFLTPGDWDHRRRNLEVPTTPARLEQVDDERVRVIRRRYLRGFADGDLRPAESASPLVDDLPMLARVFPGATVIVPVIDEQDLVLGWRLVGYRGVEAMRSLWRRERKLLAHLRQVLPLNFVEVDYATLYNEPASALEELCRRIGVTMRPEMIESVDRGRSERGYRPPGHWRNYPAEDEASDDRAS